MKLNFFTRSGKRRWGILPVYHMRLSFRNGHAETIRLSEWEIKNGSMGWVRAPGQGFFKFSLDDVISINVIRQTWRFGISSILQSSWRKGAK
jgi:hypothetical protein